MSNPTLLVTGANGRLGSQTVANLLAAKAGHVIAASRDPQKSAALAAKGAETRRADFDDPATLADAFRGATRVLIVSTDALAVPGQRLQQHRNAVEAARAAGVQEIVYTSMPNPDHSAVTFAPDHLGTEEAIKASGLRYTILRNAWYQENLLLSLPHAITAGKWYSAAGTGTQAHVAIADCARAAAAALARPSANETLTITGAQLRNVREIASLVSEVTGKPLEVVDVTDEQLAQGLKQAGMPDFFIPTLVSFDTNTRQGNFAVKTAAVRDLTGREPVSLRAFLEEHKGKLLGG